MVCLHTSSGRKDRKVSLSITLRCSFKTRKNTHKNFESKERENFIERLNDDNSKNGLTVVSKQDENFNLAKRRSELFRFSCSGY